MDDDLIAVPLYVDEGERYKAVAIALHPGRWWWWRHRMRMRAGRWWWWLFGLRWTLMRCRYAGWRVARQRQRMASRG